ncbi:MAG: hypothetical protein ACTSRI_03475 [Promethearchaeota archaeon]
MNNSKNVELDSLRIKINEAIRFSTHYWMIFKENTFGMATIIDLIYKKSYIEVLFFTNKDVLELGVPLLKIYTPIETKIDFNEVLLQPEFDEDGLISPLKIVEKLNKTIEKEVKHHLNVLNKEKQLIEEKFENYSLEDNLYNREIRIYFQNFVIKLSINFENYPLIPTFTFSRQLNRIIKKKEFVNLDFIKNWDEENPPHIIDVIEYLIDLIVQRLNIEPLSEGSQHLLLENVSIKHGINNLFFKIHRGQSIGIIHGKGQSFDKLSLLNLFNSIAGTHSDFSGLIRIFGKDVQLLTNNEKERIFILPEAIDSKIVSMRVKKAIKHDIKIKPPWLTSKSVLDSLLKNAGLLQLKDEIISVAEEIISFAEEIIFIAPKINKKKFFVETALEVTGLLNKKDLKFSALTPLDFLLFSIARALLQSPTIIMFSIPSGLLGHLQYEIFNNYINKIKKKFHVALILHGPKEIVSKCDQILTIKRDTTEIGTANDLIETLPQSGEIITIELNQPDEGDIKRMLELKTAIFIEERKNEKFKLFLRDDPNKIILQLIEIFGSNLFNFKRFKATLDEYLQYTQFLENEIK